MGRATGTSNYNNAVLMGIVSTQLPSGSEGWKNVAILYKQQSNEAFARDPDDIKRHWNEKLCNKFKKPTV